MNIGKIEIDMTELDAATEKAERLSAMLDEIEARFDAIDARIAARNDAYDGQGGFLAAPHPQETVVDR